MKRRGWDKNGAWTNDQLQSFVPSGVSGKRNISYDPADADAQLDVFYPSLAETDKTVLPTLVWLHGGSWISGSKDYVANYLRILASKGVTTVGVDYSLAPARIYPTPVEQANRALGYLNSHAQELHVDRNRLFMAGNSSGAQIAAQIALIITSPSYAFQMNISPAVGSSQLKGVILHSGVFDGTLTHYSRDGVLWAYFGTKDFLEDPRLLEFSAIANATSHFPPAFISSGNDDALSPHSYEFAQKLETLGVAVDRFFIPQGSPYKASHDFEFDLQNEPGRAVLQRSVEFVRAH